MSSAILQDKLKTLILRHLSKESLSGYGLIKQIEETTGWKPSYGSMYPMLEQLHNENIVVFKEEGRRKIYSLTAKGKLEFNALGKKQKELIQKVRKSMALMAHLLGSDNKKHDMIMDSFLSAMERGELPFKDVMQASTDMKLAFWELHQKNLIKKNKQKINTIISDATKKLRKLL